MSFFSLFRTYLQLQKFRDFKFTDPGVLSNDEIELRLIETIPAAPSEGNVPEYRFHIFKTGTSLRVGYIDFRIFLTVALSKFGGNIGYGILPEFHGQYYAAKALLLLKDFIKNSGLSSVLITCGETNIASRKTCEYVGARLVKVKKALTDMDEWSSTCYYLLRVE